ncbi:putative translation regulator protein [Golovinomyces cichoracearum]|uniref:Putative translation regulator protein n=1 Tax=Golovinomyces cichoracearum TaxID=62708 RepID=A0A420H887_9PEZI|nr:putative translation regulator protein [Golovinomyces cichoracearum]
MLERTNICLGSGTVRRLLISCKKYLKFLPKLHSKKYEITEPELGFFLAQEFERYNRIFATTYLDFLYPASTLGSTLQFTTSDFFRSFLSRARPCLRKKFHRHYTSSAIAQISLERSCDTDRASLLCRQNEVDIFGGLGLSRGAKIDEIWRNFKTTNQVEQKKLCKPLIKYLHHTAQGSEMVRIIELFKNLDLHERDTDICEVVIQAYLKLRDLTNAMMVYKFASRQLKNPAGCNQILSYTVSKCMWAEAFELWQTEKYLSSDFNFYRFIDNPAPNPSAAISLTGWVNSLRESSVQISHPDLFKFSTTIIEKMMERILPCPEELYVAILVSLSEWGSHGIKVYTNAIISLFKSKKYSLLLWCYKALRLNKNFYLSQSALTHVLQVSCDRHDVLSIKQVLDDFFSLHTKPSRAAYRMCMKEFSRQGDAKTVHALFRQYVSRYKNNSNETLQRSRHEVSLRSRSDKSGRSYFYEEIDEAAPLTANDFAPLLHVHAKRGEVRELDKIFDQIKILYRVEPDTLCWNIRLSSYIRIKDLDRAYECFEEILANKNCQPDHYTFGTMMALCASRADLTRAKDVFNLAKTMNVPISAAMITCLVLCLLRNEKYSAAEALCRESITMDLAGPKTRIWNTLVMGYVLNRDLPNVNRIFNYMTENKIEYDKYTYSALMQALAMTRQPNLAAKVLFEVMPKSNVKPTVFHFAVLLGGFLATKDWRSFYKVHQKILNLNLRPNASTKLLVMKAAAYEDSTLTKVGAETLQFLKSFQIFSQTMASIDPQDISDNARKGFDQVALDFMYPAIFYSYMAFILGQFGDHNTSLKLLSEYNSWIPENRQKAGQVMKILSSLMLARHNAHDKDGVRECWEKSVLLAREESKKLPPLPKYKISDEIHENDISNYHQLILNEPFGIYMKNLMAQRKTKELNESVQSLISYGFELDNHNWNEYVKNLVRNSLYYKLAFQICEAKLMPGWQGWRIQRRKLAGRRSNVPLEIRRAKRNKRYCRPFFDTMLWLARRMIDLRAKAAENPETKKLITLICREYPKTVQAIDAIPRSDNESILKSDDSQFEL